MSIKGLPPVEERTVSRTMFGNPVFLKSPASASAFSPVPSIPTFTASTRYFLRSTAISLNRNSGGTGRTACTARPSCAVSAVMAERPATPKASKTLMSACMPAPPEGSAPAMVRAVLILS